MRLHTYVQHTLAVYIHDVNWLIYLCRDGMLVNVLWLCYNTHNIPLLLKYNIIKYLLLSIILKYLLLSIILKVCAIVLGHNHQYMIKSPIHGQT